MSTWQVVMSVVVVPTAGALWVAFKWYLDFREKANERQRQHELKIEKDKRDLAVEILLRVETMEDKFVTTLSAMEERCHKNEAEQRDLRLEDQKRHIGMLHEVAMRVRPSGTSGQIQAVRSKTPSEPTKPPSSK